MAAANILEQSLPTEIFCPSAVSNVSACTIVETENKWFREIISDRWT